MDKKKVEAIIIFNCINLVFSIYYPFFIFEIAS